MSSVIDASDVTYAYGETVAVEDVSFSVEAGDFLGLLGPNGSGKTTLLHLLIGLKEPDSGRVELFGERATGFEDGERIGYVSQRSTDLASRPVGALSGGQRQRTFLARALATGADLLALDEPTVGVDADSQTDFYELLDDLNRQGITTILIEHDVDILTEHVDTVACINRELYHHGDVVSFLESDAIAEAYGNTAKIVAYDHPRVTTLQAPTPSRQTRPGAASVGPSNWPDSA